MTGATTGQETQRRKCFCGADLPQRRGQKYCNETCRQTAGRVLRHRPDRADADHGDGECSFTFCKTKFRKRRPWSRFCSDYCRSMEWQRLHRRVKGQERVAA